METVGVDRSRVMQRRRVRRWAARVVLAAVFAAAAVGAYQAGLSRLINDRFSGVDVVWTVVDPGEEGP